MKLAVIRRRLVEGGTLLTPRDDFAIVEPLLVEVLSTEKVTGELPRRLGRLPPSLPVVRALLLALNRKVPKEWKGAAWWNCPLEDLVLSLPELAPLVTLLSELDEPVRTNLWFTLSRAGVALDAQPDPSQLETIAWALLEGRADFQLEAHDRHRHPCALGPLASSAAWATAMHGALRRVLDGEGSISHLDALEPFMSTLTAEDLLQLGARASWAEESDVLVKRLERLSVDSLEAAFRATLDAEPSAILCVALGRLFAKHGQPWPKELVPKAHVDDFSTRATWKRILPLLDAQAREALLASHFPIDGTTFTTYATSGLFDALEAWGRRQPNPWASVTAMLRHPISRDAVRLAEHFLDAPVFDGPLVEVARLLPNRRIFERAETNPAFLPIAVGRLSQRPAATDDDFFFALERLPLADKERWLMQRPWSPRAVALAKQLPTSPERDFLESADLRQFLEAAPLEPLRRALASPNEKVSREVLTSLAALENGLRAALWFQPTLVRELTAAVPTTSTADAVVARLEAGVLTQDQRILLIDAALALPPVERALPHLAPRLGLKAEAKLALAWLDAAVKHELQPVIRWVEAALSDPKSSRIAVEVASLHPAVFSRATASAPLEGAAAEIARAVQKASASGHDGPLLDEALELWRTTRDGALGAALAAVADVRSEPTFQALKERSERGFQTHWVAAVKANELRAAAEALQRPGTTQHLLERIYWLSTVEPHPSVGEALVQLALSGALRGAKSRHLVRNLADALKTHGDAHTLDALSTIDEALLPAAEREAIVTAVRATVKPTPESTALATKLVALPKREVRTFTKSADVVEQWLASGKKEPWLEALFNPKVTREQQAVAADKLLEAGDRRGELLQAWSKGDEPAALQVLHKCATTWAGPLSALARVHELGFSGPAVVTHFAPGRNMTKTQEWLDVIASPLLRGVTHLAFVRGSRQLVPMITEAAKHRLAVVCVPAPSKAAVAEAVKGTSVKVVTHFDAKAFFARTTVLARR